ncbi:MAG: integrase arm-type DNA-binding domain-containing protein [Gammaproteobacteria bacterium]
MPLTHALISTIKPTNRTQRLFDGSGLYLEVSPSGAKYWRQKYRYKGKEKRLAHGVYPDISLKQARERRDTAKRLLANDIDPGEHKKSLKAAAITGNENSFEVVALEWHAKQIVRWSEVHAVSIKRLLDRDIFPWLGKHPVAEITPPQLLVVVRRIENRGAIETAHRALSNCGQIFRYGIATTRCQRDPSSDLKGALTPVKHGHFAAITEPKRIGELLRMIDGHQCTLVVSCALKLSPLLFLRPSELRKCKWQDINLSTKELRFVVSKTQEPLIVPLSKQAIAILEELKPLTENGEFVFPNARSRKRPMSNNAVLGALRSMGIPKEEMCGHGFRAMARTLLDEVLGERPDIIEHQLAHAVRDPNGRAYNRTAHLPERRQMMQRWANYLDNLREGASVVPLRAGSQLNG